MLISHESPLCLLEQSRSYNDYCYALVHLFDRYPTYYNFFVESIKLNREVLLDNSIFELKKAFESNAFAKWVTKLRPSYYVVPDELECSETTCNNFTKWLKEYNNLPGMKIGVVQGKTFQEIVECYKFMADNADYIAISFDMEYYQYTGEGKTKLQRQSSGRFKLIKQLSDAGHWCQTKPHHLLGCSLPTEFHLYNKALLPGIRSLDTSNPIMHGIEGNRYVSGYGLNFKSEKLLADNLTIKLTKQQHNDIMHNVSEFKKIANKF